MSEIVDLILIILIIKLSRRVRLSFIEHNKNNNKWRIKGHRTENVYWEGDTAQQLGWGHSKTLKEQAQNLCTAA